MNLALHVTKRQMLLLAIILVFLFATALIVIHTTLPGLWHTIAVSPDILNGRH